MDNFYSLKPGETFTLGSRKYQVIEKEDLNCEFCSFSTTFCSCSCSELRIEGFIPNCDSEQRNDNENVIFMEVNQ